MNTTFTKADAAKTVLSWATSEYTRSLGEYQKAMCNAEANKFAEKMWGEMNPDDGVGSFMSSNPYRSRNPDYDSRNITALASVVGEKRKVLDFVQNQICKQIID
jgi:hypothetical protein